jgi:hypothetical protein
MSRKTKQELVDEMALLEQRYVEMKTRLESTVNAISRANALLNMEKDDIELKAQQYEKTILVLSERLMNAREGLNTPPRMGQVPPK